MIVIKHWTLNCVVNPRYQSFGRGQSKFGIDTVCDVILAMTVEVEQILVAEIQVAGKGSIVHDAWSKFGSHFFALFATYKATREVVEDGVCKAVAKPVISIPSVAPLHTPVKEAVQGDGFLPTAEEAEVEESNNFMAQAHADYIIDILQSYYGVNPPKWITNQTCNSASVNMLLSKILGIPHINCENHLLNNEVKLWLRNSTAEVVDRGAHSFRAGTVCKVICECMVDLKNNKHYAIPCKQTDLAPTIGVETRWASAGNMMNKCAKIKDNIAKASLDEEANIQVPPTSHSFTKAVTKTTGTLKDINSVDVGLQTCMAKLSQCEELQRILIRLSETNRDESESPWNGNNIGTRRIVPDSVKQPDKAFVSAVIKMQRRYGTNLTTFLKSGDTVGKLLKGRALVTDYKRKHVQSTEELSIKTLS
jgi:hypothetical protein